MTAEQKDEFRKLAREGAESLRTTAFMAGRRGWSVAKEEAETWADRLEQLTGWILDSLAEVEEHAAVLEKEMLWLRDENRTARKLHHAVVEDWSCRYYALVEQIVKTRLPERQILLPNGVRFDHG